MFIKNIREEFYDELIKSRVLVLVAFDVDAICALRILQFLFETDNVQYTVVPVSSLADMQKTYESHKNNVKKIVLINVGGAIDITYELDLAPETKVYIADSHRPICLHNIYTDDVALLMSPDDNGVSIPDADDVIPDESDEEEDDNVDVRGLSNEQLEARQIRRDEKRVWAQRCARLMSKYNHDNFFGESVAVTFFKLAWKMSKDSNSLLWLAIIGVYDQHINDKLEPRSFEDYCSFLQSHVTRLGHMRQERVGALSEIATDGGDNAPRNNSLAIAFVQDLHLVLFRHWSLYESMRHTISICCKLKVWTPRGQKRLLEFFAELGIPLTQCRQRFSAMDLEYRKNTQEWMEALADKYDLGSISGHGFVATRGFKTKYAASDLAFAVRALLESTDKDRSPNQKFLDAMDALSWQNGELLETGVELAKVQLTAILKQTQHIIDMNSIGKVGQFLYTVIKESAPDAKIFCYPAALLALARFLQTTFVAKTKYKQANECPLVIITPDINNPGTGFMAGIPPLSARTKRNFFGEAFRHLQERKLLSFETFAEFYDPCVVRVAYSERACGELVSAVAKILNDKE